MSRVREPSHTNRIKPSENLSVGQEEFDSFLFLFSGVLEKFDDSYIFEVPTREFGIGELREDEVYRVPVFRRVNADREPRETNSGQTRN